MPFLKYGIFLIVPGIVLGFSIFLKIAAGPYWLGPNLDPSYQYLVNGVYLIKGLVPNHTDHPGTPVQMMCCAVDWLFNIGRSAGEVVTCVFTAPEFYLHAVFVILSLFFLFTSFGLAVYVFRKTGDVLAAILAQLPALSFLVLKSWDSSDPVLPIIVNVSPEPLLMSVVNLFNICLLMYFFAKKSKDEYGASLCWGLVSGLGTATKITFLPLLAVPLIVLSWKNKILFIGAFGLSFFLWTLPIISKYPAIWAWLSGILTHTGIHGAGKSGIIEFHSYLLNWKDILIGQAVFASIAFAALAVILWKILDKKWDRETFFLAAIFAGICAQFAIVAKHPGPQYLLPGLGLFSSLLVLFYLQGPGRGLLGRRIILVLILTGIFFGAWQANAYRARLADLTKDILVFHDENSIKYKNCIFVDYYRSSSQEAALFFGDGWNLSPHLGEDLFPLYPNKYYFHIWGNRILSFNGKIWANDLLNQGPCVVFRGDGGFDFSRGPYEVRLLEKGPFESIHLLTGTTEKQASILMAGAMQFIQAGDKSKAMICALEARKLHYQPEVSVDSLIKWLKTL